MIFSDNLNICPSVLAQDGTFSLVDFIDAFVEPEVQRVLRAYENCITVDVHCSPEGDWTTERIAKEAFARSCKVRVNPDDHLTAGGTPIGNRSKHFAFGCLSWSLISFFGFRGTGQRPILRVHQSLDSIRSGHLQSSCLSFLFSTPSRPLMGLT
jgi:hypothetical protein